MSDIEHSPTSPQQEADAAIASWPTTRWMELATPEAVADGICRLFSERGGNNYDEVISQTTHAVQAAELARSAGADDALVVAALLHDIGHLFEPTERDTDLHHEEVASRFLANWFGPEVTEPIRHHVAAKRYLCAVDPDYEATLSTASVVSLGLQGGVMTPDETAEFASRAGTDDAVLLRRWDDLAKDPDRPTAAFDDFRPLLVALARVA